MPNTVQTPTNPVNEAHKQYNQSRTQFPMTYLHYTTENYGLINPFFAMEGVPGDTIPLDSKQGFHLGLRVFGIVLPVFLLTVVAVLRLHSLKIPSW